MSVDATATPSLSHSAENKAESASPAKPANNETPATKQNGWKTALAATGLLVAVGAALHYVLPKSNKAPEKESA